MWHILAKFDLTIPFSTNDLPNNGHVAIAVIVNRRIIIMPMLSSCYFLSRNFSISSSKYIRRFRRQVLSTINSIKQHCVVIHPNINGRMYSMSKNIWSITILSVILPDYDPLLWWNNVDFGHKWHSRSLEDVLKILSPALQDTNSFRKHYQIDHQCTILAIMMHHGSSGTLIYFECRTECKLCFITQPSKFPQWIGNTSVL